jgi:hypothetical protein
MPLAHFVDSYEGDSVAVTIETDGDGDIHPAVYVRRGPVVTEHLLPSAPLHDFDTGDHHKEISSLLKGWV